MRLSSGMLQHLLFSHLGWIDPNFFFQCWEIRSGTGDLEHFVYLRRLSALFTYMADHDFHVADVVNMGATNPKICYIEK